MSIRGARSSATKPAPALLMPVDLQSAEGQLHDVLEPYIKILLYWGERE